MWYYCPASAIISTLSKWSPSIWAATGTGVMSKIEGALDDFDFEVDDFDKYVGYVETVDGMEVKYTQEDMDAAKDCFEAVSTYEDDGGVLTVEEDLNTVVNVNGAKIPIRGRLDFRLTFDDKYVIIDYKHGAGKTVTALNNYQLLIYLKMVIEKFGPKKEYVLQIVQPRARETVPLVWKMTHKQFTDVWQHIEAAFCRIKAAADYFNKYGEINYSDYEAGANCQWCTIKGSCPRRVNRAITAAVTGKVVDKWQEAPEAMLSWLLGAASEVRETLSKAEKQAEQRLKEGSKVFGFKLIKTTGRRSIRKDLDEGEIEQLRILGLVKDEPEFKALGEFDKLAKGTDFDASYYIQDGKNGVKVVPQSTPGEEVTGFVDAFESGEMEETK